MTRMLHGVLSHTKKDLLLKTIWGQPPPPLPPCAILFKYYLIKYKKILLSSFSVSASAWLIQLSVAQLRECNSWDIVSTSIDPMPPTKLATPYLFQGPNKLVGSHSTPYQIGWLGNLTLLARSPRPCKGNVLTFLFC